MCVLIINLYEIQWFLAELRDPGWTISSTTTTTRLSKESKAPHTYNHWNSHHISGPRSFSAACAFQLWSSIVFPISCWATTLSQIAIFLLCDFYYIEQRHCEKCKEISQILYREGLLFPPGPNDRNHNWQTELLWNSIIGCNFLDSYFMVHLLFSMLWHYFWRRAFQEHMK